jgi:hypothetical protein
MKTSTAAGSYAPMSIFDEPDKQLAARGWTYDAKSECFMDAGNHVDYRALLALVPAMTLDELASYVDRKHDSLAAGH